MDIDRNTVVRGFYDPVIMGLADMYAEKIAPTIDLRAWRTLSTSPTLLASPENYHDLFLLGSGPTPSADIRWQGLYNFAYPYIQIATEGKDTIVFENPCAGSTIEMVDLASADASTYAQVRLALYQASRQGYRPNVGVILLRPLANEASLAYDIGGEAYYLRTTKVATIFPAEGEAQDIRPIDEVIQRNRRFITRAPVTDRVIGCYSENTLGTDVCLVPARDEGPPVPHQSLAKDVALRRD